MSKWISFWHTTVHLNSAAKHISQSNLTMSTMHTSIKWTNTYYFALSSSDNKVKPSKSADNQHCFFKSHQLFHLDGEDVDFILPPLEKTSHAPLLVNCCCHLLSVICWQRSGTHLQAWPGWIWRRISMTLHSLVSETTCDTLQCILNQVSMEQEWSPIVIHKFTVPTVTFNEWQSTIIAIWS